MPELIRQENWSGGANNKADKAKLPATEAGRTIREGVNVDIMPGGSFRSRIGFEQYLAGSSVRSLVAGHGELFFLDGTNIKRFVIADGGIDTIGSVGSSSVTMAGDLHNNEAMLLTSDGTALRCRNRVARKWGVPTMPAQPIATLRTVGSMMLGRYQYACTLVNEYGEEGGTVTAGVVELTAGYGSFTLSGFQPIPSGYSMRVYISPCNGSTLYLQAERTVTSSIVVEDVFIDSMQLETMGMREPPASGHIVRSFHGTILIADGAVLWLMQPLRVHLLDRTSGFFQFPGNITNVETVDTGVFITTASRTFFLSGVETSEPSMTTVYTDVGGFPHSGISTGKDQAAWMTERGQALGGRDGSVTLIHKDSYAPLLMPDSSSGIVRNDGAEILVTAPKPPTGTSSLKAASYFDAEVVTSSKTGPLDGSLSVTDNFDTEVVAP